MSARLVLAGCLLAVAACSDIRSQTASYATADEARSAGAIERGQLPDILPPGAYEIRSGYVPDTTHVWGLFNFPPEQGEALRVRLGPQAGLDGLSVDVPSRIEWWPPALRQTLHGEQLRLTGLQGYRSLDGALVVAVHWAQGRAYYWSAAR
jgi:hypothetical protein